MNKILLPINLVFFIAVVLYGCISGNLHKNMIRQQEGQRVLIKINNNFPNSILEKKLFKYFEIELKLKGVKSDYWSLFFNDGYKPINNNMLCKEGNSIKISDDFEYIHFVYEYNSKLCY